MLTYCKIRPAVNQIELHPYNVQNEVVRFLERLGIAVEAYAPLCSLDYDKLPEELEKKTIFDEKVIQDLADKY